MNDNIRIFPGAAPPTAASQPKHEALCRVLRDMLAMAETGELQSLFATGFMRDGARLTLRGGHHRNIYEVVGAIEWLKVEFASKVIHDTAGEALR